MKVCSVEVHLLEKGDRIQTGYGEATVVEDEIFNEYDREVKVLLDDGCSEKPNGHREAFFVGLYGWGILRS